MLTRLTTGWQALRQWAFDRYYLVEMIDVPPIFGAEEPPPLVPAGRTVVLRRRR